MRYLQKPKPYEIKIDGVPKPVILDIDEYLLLVFKTTDPFQLPSAMRKARVAMKASEEAGPGGVAPLEDDLHALLHGLTESKNCPQHIVQIEFEDGTSGRAKIWPWDMEPILDSIANAGVTPPEE